MSVVANRIWMAALCASLVAMSSTGWSAGPPPHEAANKIDRLLTKELHTGISEKPAGRTDDEVFLRRVMLDIVGQPPTVEDVIAFSLDPSKDKRAKVVEKLLGDRSYGDNWASYWRDVIFYRRSEDRALIAANATTRYLTEQLNKNTAWDELARSFMTASGDVRTEGQTGLIMAQAGRPEETVAEISRIFLGIQVQCAQCHDHPTDRWKREQFHHLAAFFPRVAVRPNRNGLQRTFMVYASDTEPRFQPRNTNNRFRGTLEHRMTDLNKPGENGKLMEPVFFITDQKLATGVKDADRREHLAQWITSPKNSWFAKAFVNRMWSELVGEGFYEPVDDIGPDRIATAPETLDYLATSFVKSGHDVKWLMQAITATEAYQRQSRSRRNPDQTPFLASCNQRLRADQLFDSLLQVLEIEDRGGSSLGGGPMRALRTPRAQFNAAFGYDPSIRRDEVTGSIPQALALMNSSLIDRAIRSSNGRLGKLLKNIEDDEDLTVELYLLVLARQPTDNEIKTCLAYVKEVGNRKEAFEDLLWSLINSTEFIHRR